MSGIDPIFILVLGVPTIVAAILAVYLKNMLRSVVAYALSSVLLSALFFLLYSPFAGALELTVGAGLVAVLFLVALILSGGEEFEVST